MLPDWFLTFKILQCQLQECYNSICILKTFMSQNLQKKKKAPKMLEHHQDENHPKNTHPVRGSLPFDGLWCAGQSMVEYNALHDMHASYYFGNPTVVKQMNKLTNSLTKTRPQISSNTLHDIKTQRIKIKKILQKHQTIQNIKILPYSTGLRQQSQQKLSQFKKILKIKQVQKQHEHEQYLKQYWVNKLPDKPEIKVVRTLDCVGDLRLGKLGNFREYVFQDGGCKGLVRRRTGKGT